MSQRLVSDAEVAEIGYTAFTSRRRSQHVTARLIVRRVRRLNPKTAGQSEMFAVYRYHAVFTDSTEPMLAAEATHRDHAIIEQVIEDLKDSALAHLPSGVFTANAAWLVCAALAHNLTRAAGALASSFHARARTATLRAHLINTPGRIARSAGQLVLHLPQALALRSRARRAVPPCATRPTAQHSLTTEPAGPDRNIQWNSRPDRQINHAHNHESQTKIN